MDEIFNLILQSVPNEGQNPEILDVFRSDDSSFDVIRERFCESAGNKPAQLFLSSCLLFQTRKRILNWRKDEQEEMIRWVMQQFPYFSDVSIIKTFGTILGMCLQGISSDIEQLVDILNRILAQIHDLPLTIYLISPILTVFSESDTGNSLSKRTFATHCLSLIFEFVQSILNSFLVGEALLPDFISESLQIASELYLFNVSADYRNHDQRHFALSVAPMIKDYLSDPEIAELFIQIYQKTRDWRCLLCVYNILSATNSSFIMQSQSTVLACIAKGVTEILSSPHFDATINTKWQCLVLMKLGPKVLTCFSPGGDSILTLLSVVNEFTLRFFKYCRSFQDNKDEIVHLLSFWDALVNSFLNISTNASKEALRTYSNGIFHIIYAIFKSFLNQEANSEIIDDTSFTNLFRFAYISDPVAFSSHMAENLSHEEHLLSQSSINLIQERCIAFDLLLVLSMLTVYPKSSLDVTSVRGSATLILAFLQILSAVQNILINQVVYQHIERVIIQIISIFPTSVSSLISMIKESSIAVDFVKIFAQNIQERALSHLTSLLISVGISEEISMSTLKCLRLFQLERDFISDFLNNLTESSFPYLSESSFCHARVQHYAFKYWLYLKNPGASTFDKIVRDLSDLFSRHEVEGLEKALLSVRGLLSVSLGYEDYGTVNNWFMNAIQPVLVDMTEEIAKNPHLSYVLLKTWFYLVTTTPTRPISFPFDSPSGVILFKTTTKFLQNTLNGLIYIPEEIQQIKSVRYFLLISNSLVTCKWTPFAVFQHYNDPVLIHFYDLLQKSIETVLKHDFYGMTKIADSSVSLCESILNHEFHNAHIPVEFRETLQTCADKSVQMGLVQRTRIPTFSSSSN